MGLKSKEIDHLLIRQLKLTANKPVTKHVLLMTDSIDNRQPIDSFFHVRLQSLTVNYSLSSANGVLTNDTRACIHITQEVFVSSKDLLIKLILFHLKPHKTQTPLFERLTPCYLIFSATILIILTFIIALFDTHIVFVSIFAMSARDNRF